MSQGSGVIGAAEGHPVHVRLAHGPLGERAEPTCGGVDEPAFGIGRYSRCRNVFLKKRFSLSWQGIS